MTVNDSGGAFPGMEGHRDFFGPPPRLMKAAQLRAFSCRRRRGDREYHPDNAPKIPNSEPCRRAPIQASCFCTTGRSGGTRLVLPASAFARGEDFRCAGAGRPSIHHKAQPPAGPRHEGHCSPHDTAPVPSGMAGTQFNRAWMKSMSRRAFLLASRRSTASSRARTPYRASASVSLNICSRRAEKPA